MEVLPGKGIRSMESDESPENRVGPEGYKAEEQPSENGHLENGHHEKGRSEAKEVERERPEASQTEGAAESATDQQSAEATSAEGVSKDISRVGEIAAWWWRWWLETRGVLAGIVTPVAVALLAAAIYFPSTPLGLAFGVVLGLLWGAGRSGKIAAGVSAAIVLLGAIAGVVGVTGVVILFVILMLNVFLFAVLGGGGYLLYKLLVPKPQEPHYTAHWAQRGEVEDMIAPITEDGNPDTGDGIILGLFDGDWLVLKPGLGGRKELGSGLVVGPSRSGKGLNLVSNLLSWEGSAIVLDIKKELYETTAPFRAGALSNNIRVLDPSGRGHRYDPFAELGYSEQSMKRAVNLILETDKARDPIFARRAASAVYAGLLGAQIEGAPALAYLREATAEGPQAYVEQLSALGDSEIRRSLVDFLGGPPEELEPRDYRNDRFLSSAWSTITAQLSEVFSDGILKMTGGNDFYAADLVQSPQTLYLMFEESELDYTSKIFQVMMLALTTGLIRNSDADRNAENTPMLVALDEAGRTPIPRLDDMVSTVAGRGVTTWIYVQDLSQLEAAYGREQAQTIRAGCHTQIYYRPIEQTTAEQISRMCGQMTVIDRKVNTNTGTIGYSESVGQKPRELISADELRREMPDEGVIVFASRKPPIKAGRANWLEMWDAAEDIQDNPAPLPPELSLPDLSMNGSSAAEPAEPEESTEEEETERPEEPSDDSSEDERRRDREKGEEPEDYIEPDI